MSNVDMHCSVKQWW